MQQVRDYSKDLRQMLAVGKGLNDALQELRCAGASMFDCIRSVRAIRQCELAEAKRVVESSPAWSASRG
jgi:hypothetical protein